MKKITFLLFILTSFCFSQELLTNGDFESCPTAPSDCSPWFGNAVNAVDDGSGNFVNQANVMTAGDAFAVNISQVESMTSGTTYAFSFDAYTDSATASRTMVVGIGLNEAPWTAVVETITLTDASQNFSFNLTANFTSANSRVIFDMGADTGFVFIDNVSLMESLPTCDDGVQNGDEEGVDCGGTNCAPCMTMEPTTPAPTPTRDAADVISVFSDAYMDIAVSEFSTVWDNADVSDSDINGDNVKVYSLSGGAFIAVSYTHLTLPTIA